MSRKMRQALAGLAVVAASTVVYLPGLPGEFVYDDHRLIVDNDGLKRPLDLRRSFLRDYYASDIDRMGLGYYRPVALLSNELDYRRGGGAAQAFHATNIAIHVACALLVLVLGVRLLGPGISASAAALLFALNPVHAESVAFISGRVDPLATLFGLATLLAHLAANRSAAPSLWRAPAGLAWLAALMSKEIAFTVPAVALLLEIAEEGWPGPTGMLERLPRYAPYAAAWVLYLPLRWMALGTLLPPSAKGAGWAVTRPPIVVGSYLAWLVVPPHGLHLEPGLASGALGAGAVLLAAAALAGCWTLARRGWRLEAALVAVTLVALLPVAQFRPLETTLSERFLYLPSVAAALLAGALLRRLPAGRITIVALSVVGLLLVVYASILIPRARIWRDEIALWEAKERETPGGSLKARLNIARTYAHRGDRERALKAYDAAKALEPSLAGGLSAEISALKSEAGSDEYARGLLASLKDFPKDGALWNNLGFHLYRKGDMIGATMAFLKATELTPARSTAWLGLALARLSDGDIPAADEAASRALTLQPDLALAVVVRAACALGQGHPCDALRLSEEIAVDDPSDRAMLDRIVARARRECHP